MIIKDRGGGALYHFGSGCMVHIVDLERYCFEKTGFSIGHGWFAVCISYLDTPMKKEKILTSYTKKEEAEKALADFYAALQNHEEFFEF